jgi:hypothetical protein
VPRQLPCVVVSLPTKLALVPPPPAPFTVMCTGADVAGCPSVSYAFAVSV